LPIFFDLASDVPRIRKQFEKFFTQAARRDGTASWGDEMRDAYAVVADSVVVGKADDKLRDYVVMEQRGAMAILGYRVEFALEIVASELKSPAATRTHEAYGKVSFFAYGEARPFHHFFVDGNGRLVHPEDEAANENVERPEDAVRCVRRVIEALITSRMMHVQAVA
jgi:hypothetical protein